MDDRLSVLSLCIHQGFADCGLDVLQQGFTLQVFGPSTSTCPCCDPLDESLRLTSSFCCNISLCQHMTYNVSGEPPLITPAGHKLTHQDLLQINDNFKEILVS